jgi:hypothetical protein
MKRWDTTMTEIQTGLTYWQVSFQDGKIALDDEILTLDFNDS